MRLTRVGLKLANGTNTKRYVQGRAPYWVCVPSPGLSGFWRGAIKEVQEIAPTSELTCSATSKNRADKKLGRLPSDFLLMRLAVPRYPISTTL